ncbi:MAG: CAP domain-containing protein [Bacteroidota bacterium]
MIQIKCMVLPILFLLSSCSTPVQEPIHTPSSSFGEDLLSAINELRVSGCQCGNTYMSAVDPLTWDLRLESAAEMHAKDMHTNDFFDHKGSDGSQVWDRVGEAGFDWMAVAENIAWGHDSIEEVVQSWKKSSGHCKTLMSPEYSFTGAAKVGTYWVQTFADQ